MTEAPHWALRTPAQQSAFEAGRRDEENDEEITVMPRYADPVEQACYLAGRDQVFDELNIDHEWYY